MTTKSDWEGRTGRKWAEEWRRTDRSFAGLTDRLLSVIRSDRVEHALDVGCGAGEVTLAVAREFPRARVVGIDVSQPLIDVAVSRGTNLPNAGFVTANAARWSEPGIVLDTVVSRHGVMFFDDPVAAFANLAASAATGARLIFSCFRARHDNAWATDIPALLPLGVLAETDPQAPGPFAFADAHRVEAILLAGGWREIAFEPVDYAFVAGAGGDPVADALTYFLSIGPAAVPAAGLDHDERVAFIERLERFLSRHRDGSIVALGAAAWIVTARKP